MTETSRYGYSGRLLHVDLNTGVGATEELSDQEWRRYVGGGLLGVRRLLTDTPAQLDPFHPDALLMFLSSVVAGHRGVGLPRCIVVAKSPLTGGVGEARVTGPFGVALKSSSWDGLVLRGRAPAPSYLVIDADGVRLCQAGDLWGAETHRVTDALKERHGSAVAVAVIGPAGERLVRYASVLTEWTHPAARMGLGAVMGSKNVKAVVIVSGDLPPVHSPDDLADITDGYRSRIPRNPLTAAQSSPTSFGGWFLDQDMTGYIGVGNFETSLLPILPVDSAEVLARRLTTPSGECPGCPNDCIKRYDNDVDEHLGGLDEEGLASLVLGAGITDIATALHVHARCQALGIDPVSLSSVWAFLRELGRDTEDLSSLLEKIAARSPGYESFGEGVRRLADSLGASATGMHVKGMELGRYDPRVSAGQALAYAVSPIGPRYEIVEHDIDFDPVDGPPHGLDQMRALGTYTWEPMARLDAERVARTVTLLDLWSGLDALGVCLFSGPPMRELTQQRVTKLVTAVTGWLTSDYELLLWGRRRWNLMRLYNMREGIGGEFDCLPDRFFDEPVDTGRHKGAMLDRAVFARSLQQYYQLVGWDNLGRPTPTTLAALGLLWADGVGDENTTTTEVNGSSSPTTLTCSTS